MNRTSEEKVLSGISHLAAVLFGLLGLVAALVIYFVYKQKSAFAAAHAKQAVGLGVVRYLVSLVFGLLMAPLMGGLTLTGMMTSPRSFGMLGAGMMGLIGLVGMAIFLAFLVLGIIAAIKGFQGDEYRYPVFGDVVARLGE